MTHEYLMTHSDEIKKSIRPYVQLLPFVLIGVCSIRAGILIDSPSV